MLYYAMVYTLSECRSRQYAYKVGGCRMLTSVFDIEMKKIISGVLERTNQQYLDKRITKPDPPALKLGLLFLYLYSKSYSIEDIRSICIATGLIQMGLDIHEDVTNERLHTPKNIERRQLQVLAGDYFSSQYYRLLALLDLPNIIRKIAKSVQKINEYKVLFYQRQKKLMDDFDQWISHKKDIETGIFYGFIAKEDDQWQQIISDFMYLEILTDAYKDRRWNTAQIQQKVLGHIENMKQFLEQYTKLEAFQLLRNYLDHFETAVTPSLVAEEI